MRIARMSKAQATRTFITQYVRQKQPHEKLWAAVVEKFMLDSIRGRDTLVEDLNEGFLFACDMCGLNPHFLKGLLK